MSLKRYFVAGCALIGILASLAAPHFSLPTSIPSTSVVHAQDGVVPEFEPADCGFYAPADMNVECGYVTVPEDRSQPEGATIRLHVAKFASIGEEPRTDPVVFLTGGPGGGPGSNESSAIPLSVTSDYAVFLDRRDFILIDQRGSGYSEPKLDCRLVDRLPLQTIGESLSAEEIINQRAAALNECYAEYIEDGVNLPAYNTAASAADVNDVRLAMGYEEWNLYGLGYGTRLALTVMRDYPEGIRSAILDSPIPLQADYLTDNPAHINATFQQLFDNCAASEECAADFPDLEETFYNIVTTLNEEPIIINVTHPVSSQPFEMLVDGQRFMDTMRWSMYFSDNIQFLPFIINAVANGNLSFYKLFAEQLLTTPQYLSEIAHYSYLCNEEIAFADRDSVAGNLQSAREEAQPYLSIDTAIVFSVCDEWGLESGADATHEAVESDIPTLIISGEYDSIAPPEYAEMTAETLSSSFLYIFPGQSHSIVFALDICPLRSVARFIETPTADPNLECFAEMASTNFLSRADMANLANDAQDEAQNQP